MTRVPEQVLADRIVEQTTSGPVVFYEVRIRVERSVLEAAGLQMTPGMPVVAYVKTKDPSLIEYLLLPLVQSVRRCFRER